MRSTFARPGVIALWGFQALMLIGVLFYASPAQAFTCGEVKLAAASGVIGPVQRYTFSARCTWAQTESKTSVGIGGITTTSVNSSIVMDVIGHGKWERKSGLATETLKVTGSGGNKVESGSFSGEWSATGTCNEDPFLKDPPGGVPTCTGMNVVVNLTGHGGLIAVFSEPKRFLLERKIPLVEAQALSSQPSPPPPPAPPPPQPNPKEPLKRADGPVKAAPGAAVVLVKPNLVVVSHVATIEPNCKAPKPAMRVEVTIRNTGGPLPANDAAVYVKEPGGTNLGSGAVALPPLGSGQEYKVNLALISPQPYSSLPGRHQLQVLFGSQVARGPLSFGTTPYFFNTAFPPEHCQVSRQPIGAAVDVPQSPAGG